MKKFDLYGVGAAIVDTEVEVSDKFLSEAVIKKGVMTLVNENFQSELLASLETDGKAMRRSCGGSVCNSLVAASKLGAKTFFSGKVAADLDGELFVNDLRKSGVTFQSAMPESGVTGKCLVMVTADAERTMNTFLGVSDNLSMREIDHTALKDSEWLYIEGYLVTNIQRVKAVKEALDIARKNDVKVAISLSDPFVVSVFGDTLRNIIGSGVDLIFCNSAEAIAFTGENSLELASEDLKKYAKSFAITDGASGSLTFDGATLVRSAGNVVKAVDTNGAGDMFAGAFLYSIILGKSYEFSANLANYCASKVVEQFGPRLSLNKLMSIKEEFNV
jgi:sugar/nucleoside kinase (ribokinase family)